MTSIILSVISMLGGLAMFLYGMDIMGDGLKNSSADTLRRILGKITSNPISGFLLGFLITALIQSSTATIVLSVGLIGAGVLTLRQSIAIMLGANVGTTITGQIIRLLDVESSGTGIMQFFEPSTLSPIALIIGIILIMFVKKGNSKNIGLILMGFGILFVGLLQMTNSVKPLANSEFFSDIIGKYANIPALGLLFGILVTTIVQSSSASVGILQSLCVTGAIRFPGAYSYVIGAALGTCIVTAVFCSIGTKEDAKRLALMHFIFNLISGIIWMLIISLLHSFDVITELYNSTVFPGEIADFQTIFKLSSAIVALPCIPLLEKLSRKLIKDSPHTKEDSIIEEKLKALDQHLLSTPSLAISQTERVIADMAALSLKNYESCKDQVFEYSENRTERIESREDLLDRMTDTTNQYLILLAPSFVRPEESRHVNYLIHSLTRFERIGDLAINILDNVQRMNSDNSTFSEEALKELEIVFDAVSDILQKASDAFITNDVSLARQVEPLEEVIDDLIEILNDRHFDRQKNGVCTILNGIAYLNILQNLERIADQCSDLAVNLISRTDMAAKGREHSYIKALHDSDDVEYRRMFKENRVKYLSWLNK